MRTRALVLAALVGATAVVGLQVLGAASPWREVFTVEASPRRATLTKNPDGAGVLLELERCAEPDEDARADGAASVCWVEHLRVSGPSVLQLLGAACVLDDTQRPPAFPASRPACEEGG